MSGTQMLTLVILVGGIFAPLLTYEISERIRIRMGMKRWFGEKKAEPVAKSESPKADHEDAADRHELSPGWHRVRAKKVRLRNSGDYTSLREKIEERSWDDPDANLISSRIEGTYLHAPVLDIDLPCELLESSTPGHYHLYIDCPMDWKKYKKLLGALADAGIVENGWVTSSIKDGATFVRAPGILKYEIEKTANGLKNIVEQLERLPNHDPRRVS